VKPGRRTLKLIGFRQASPDDELLELLLGEDGGEEPPGGPARLSDLIAGIESLGRWDGVRVGVQGHKKRAFKDGDLVITGRAQTRVRVVRR
jgi:hypothetical protein